MGLGLGSTLSKGGVVTPGIITDNLVLKHMYGAGEVVPVSDGAAYFDGSDDKISLTETTRSVDDSAMTIAFWVNRSTVNTWDTILGHSSYESYSWIAFDDDADRVLIESLTNGNNVAGTISPNMEANRWYHFALSLGTDGTGQWYQDGVAISTAGDLTDDFKYNQIATTATTHNHYGYLCNLAHWNATLTQAQIKSIMWKNYAGLTDSEKTNLVSWWNLSADANDSHGSNNGTLS